MEKYSWLKAGLLASGISIALQIVGIIPCLNCLFLPIQCIAWLALPLGSGYLAAYWSKLARDQMGQAAQDGALSGLVLGVIGGIVSFGISILSSLLNLGTQTASSFFSENSEYADLLPFSTIGIGSTLICAGVGMCFGIVFDVILGALGGIIKVALSKE